jgi:hypothetical protein
MIDLEKDRLAVDLKRPKIVFFIWVIGVAEIILHGSTNSPATDRDQRARIVGE